MVFKYLLVAEGEKSRALLSEQKLDEGDVDTTDPEGDPFTVLKVFDHPTLEIVELRVRYD